MFQFTHPVWGATSLAVERTVSTLFQFTHPVWGATVVVVGVGAVFDVSIHAPRVGCDWTLKMISVTLGCFNSRTPCGVRRIKGFKEFLDVQFQFTHPVWGATVICGCPTSIRSVSIHAPRVGCDNKAMLIYIILNSFNSRTPCGVRHQLLSDPKTNG